MATATVKMQRAPFRTALTKACTTLDTLLKSDTATDIAIEHARDLMLDKAERVYQKDKEVLDSLTDEAALTTEVEKVDEYRDRVIELKLAASKRLTTSQPTPPKSDPGSINRFATKFKLPPIQFKKFDGQPQNWLPFWSQFKKVDDSKELLPEDKFHYLQQCMTQGSKAEDLINSYPLSGLNYTKAVTQLKERFAQDQLLIDYYIRELLKLVLVQVQGKGQPELSFLVDKLETQLKSLESLGVTTNNYEAMLYPVVESALPRSILQVWERNKYTSFSSSNLDALMKFLKSEVQSEQKLKLAYATFDTNQGKLRSENLPFESTVPATASALVNNSDLAHVDKEGKSVLLKCLFCSNAHSTPECMKAQRMTLEERKKSIRDQKACPICLKVHANKCRSWVKCLVCGKRHHVIMCPDIKQVSTKDKDTKKDQEKPKESSSFANILPVSDVFMETVKVKIVYEGRARVVRALLDNASQLSYLTANVIRDLNCASLGQVTIDHKLFGGVSSVKKHGVYIVTVCSLINHYRCDLQVFEQPTISGSVKAVENQQLLQELQHRNIHLSDSNDSSPIEMLLGNDVYGQLLTGNKVDLDGPTAIQTEFGWVLSGRSQKFFLTGNVISSVCLNNMGVPALWDMDLLGIKDPIDQKSRETLDQETWDYFHQTVTQDETGRYCVTMPWLAGHPELTDNFALAKGRLMSVTNKLMKNKSFQAYADNFNAWEADGIIERVAAPRDQIKHYLPHHPVFKANSQTTKIRPVFNASAKTLNGASLNDCLSSGPNLLEKIPPLLVKFRLNKLGVTADVRKAFLQLQLPEGDRQYLGFLWWEDETAQTLRYYRHRRVVFGVTCSPFLLNATFDFHLNNQQVIPDHLHATAEELKSCFYVDDCVTSLNDQTELNKFIPEAKEVMQLGKFDLASWTYTRMEAEDQSDSAVSVLGLKWDFQSDLLSCYVTFSEIQDQEVLTKRRLLSFANKIYDPVGFTAPATLMLKLWLQEAWQQKSGWDDPLPTAIEQPFRRWLSQTDVFTRIQIPRHLGPGNSEAEDLSLHVFSDASGRAFACCVFLRVANEDDVSLQLVLAKTRVAPKQATIPRLELMSNLISVRMMDSIRHQFDSEVPVTYWSDSMISLHWIKGSGTWNIFVGNRVKEIRHSSNPSSWRHVPGHQNPADLPSRGCDVLQLEASEWWLGPPFLRGDHDTWPVNNIRCTAEELQLEQRHTALCMLIINDDIDYSRYTERISSYDKMIHVLAWIWRLRTNLRNPQPVRTDQLALHEITHAEEKLLQWVQISLHDVNLRYTVEDDGLMHVATKLLMDDKCAVSTRPVLLPSKHIVTQRLIETEHGKLQHAGVGTTLQHLRGKYWILQGRRAVRKVIKGCGRCKRFAAKAVQTPPVPLPLDRIKTVATFQVTGVDLAGPLYLKDGSKSWICLFTCAVYRAVHLELVTSLSTECFLLALRRFIARRGRPHIVYSDNGTNFTGANNLLQDLDWDLIEHEALIRKIEWRFNPPAAPWWGGFWERMVRTIKDLLKRNLGNSRLYYEELYTVLCDCESIVNQRPLTYQSDDPSELRALTPKDFLQDLRGSDVSDFDIIDQSLFQGRYKFVQEVRDAMRSRFQREYLANLVHRGKNQLNEQVDLVQVGDIVLVSNDTNKRINWPLARVIEIFPGRDGVTRMVRLKLQQGELVRPVQKIFPLELHVSEGKPLLQKSPDAPVPAPNRPASVDQPAPSVQPEIPVVPPVTVPKVTRLGRPINVPKRFLNGS